MSDTPAQILGRIRRDLALLEAILARGGFDAPVTGWRHVRGSHGESYVRDPEGRDKPPADATA